MGMDFPEYQKLWCLVSAWAAHTDGGVGAAFRTEGADEALNVQLRRVVVGFSKTEFLQLRA